MFGNGGRITHEDVTNARETQSLYPADRLAAERRRFLSRVIVGMLILSGVHLVVSIASGAAAEVWRLFGYPVFGALMVAALRLAMRGRLRVAGWMMVGSMYVTLTSVGSLWGALEPGIGIAFIVLVLVAGFSMGSRAAGIAAIVSAMTLAALTAMQGTGMLPPAIWVSTPATMTAFTALSVVNAGALIWYGLKRLESAVSEAETKESQAIRALRDLNTTRQDNELRAMQGDALARLAGQLVRLDRPRELSRDAVEAVSQTLGVGAVALVGVGDRVTLEHGIGLKSLAVDAPASVELSRFAEQDRSTVIDGCDQVRELLGGLLLPDDFAHLALAPVRTRSRRGLLLTGSSRVIADADVAFMQTVADMLGALRERQEVESELRQAQKMEVVGQISGSVAHDFNNLLFAILGSSQLLMRRFGKDDPNAMLLDNIIRASEHASMLTRQLLAFARRRPETADVHDLGQIVADLAKLLDRLTGERVRLVVDGVDEPIPVVVDRGNVEQVLFNLVANASDAIEADGEVRVAYRTDGVFAALSVSDDGCGMSEVTARSVFEPFFTTKSEGRGTGLGLATVKRIVDDSGGEITVESEPGVGTTFRVRLPLAEQQAEEKRKLETVPPPAPFAATILILDDNELVRRSTRAMLEGAGHRVIEAADGARGVELISNGGDIDVVLSDVVMPGLDGVELVERVREEGSDVPIILMTGYADPDLDLGAVERASDLLHKPVRQVELLTKVNEVLERR
jgi:signal transduction histidine kinase